MTKKDGDEEAPKPKRKPRVKISKGGALGLGDEAETEDNPLDSPVPQIKTIRVSRDEKSPSTTPRSSSSTPRSQKSKLGNVWNRLTGGSTPKDKSSSGRILPFCSTENDENSGLVCKQVMVGHSKPIVAMHASFDGEYFISSSKDKTVKVWDLTSSKVKRLL